MAYATTNPPALISQGIARGTNKESRIWQYSSADSFALVSASGYFTNGYSLGIRSGDIINQIDNDGVVFNTLLVTADSASASTITVTSLISQSLTASGAVTPGVKSIELNHASVAIAATIATSLVHQGLFMVVNTSASGTAAHTVTLTTGTWNGTNKVLTLDAPKEAVIVWFDSAGNGTIVENVGTVTPSG